MTESHLLKFLFGALLFVALLHFVGLYFFWYWHFAWYDILVHILGGIVASKMVLYTYLYGRVGITREFAFWRLMPLVLGMTLVIGIFWELYELAFGMTHWGGPGYFPDTLLDLINDAIGALIGFSAYAFLRRTASTKAQQINS